MLSTLSAKNGVTWKNLSNPEPKELAEFAREANLDPHDGEFVAQSYLRPEIAIKDAYILILIHVPTFDRQLRVTKSAPLYLIATKDKLWTVSYTRIVSLEKLIKEFEEIEEKREEYFSNGGMSLALHITSSMYASAFRKLIRLRKHINIAEEAVFRGNERNMVVEISLLTRDVMDFRKIVRAQRELFSKPPKHELVATETANQWIRLNGQTNKLWEFLEGLFETVHELNATNENLLQHKENELLRMLTYYSTITIPVLILLSVINPTIKNATMLDSVIYWGVWSLLVISLVIILFIFKRRKVL